MTVVNKDKCTPDRWEPGHIIAFWRGMGEGESGGGQSLPSRSPMLHPDNFCIKRAALALKFARDVTCTPRLFVKDVRRCDVR